MAFPGAGSTAESPPANYLRHPHPSDGSLYATLPLMGFEPQTAGQPLVNTRKRTTKVNFAIVLGVLLFLIIGVGFAVRASRRAEKGEPQGPPAAPAK